jgi:hypothetical protein
MRRPRLSFATGKSTLLLLFIAAGIAVGVTSCSKNDDAPTPGVTSENTAVVVTQSVTAQGGVVEQINSAITTVTNLEARKAGGRLSDFCGQSLKDSIVLSGNTNEFSFSYNLFWNYALTCVETVPQQFTFDFNGKTSIGTEKFSTKDSTSSHYVLKGLGANNTTWEISQTFNRTGELVSTTDKLPSFKSTIHYESMNIKVSKETRKIVSGSATVKISGRDSKGNSFSYTGVITFKGEGKATYITSGGNFELQW